MTKTCRAGLRAGAVLAALFIALPAQADAVADFYRGKTITIISPVGEGGTYDFYGRLGGEIMKKHLPGNPNYVMQYLVGAGGTRSNNYVAGPAPKDGTLLVSLNANTAQTQLMRPTGVKYDVRTFNMIGLFAPMNSAITVWHTAPAKTVQDAMKTEVVIGATGRGSYQYQFPVLMNALIGTKFKVVTGYKSIPDENLAMERGEIHGRGGTIPSWDITRPEWVRENKIRHLIQVGAKRSPRFADVPLATEMVKSEEEKQMILLISSGALLGRSLAGPPGIPAERVKAMRDAFDRGTKDPDILAFAKKHKLFVEPGTGDELAEIVRDIMATPRPIVQRTMELLGIKATGGKKKKQS